MKTVDSASISFSLVDDEETRQLWNHNFELAFRVVLTTNNLNIQLEVSNIGKKFFSVFVSWLNLVSIFRLRRI